MDQCIISDVFSLKLSPHLSDHFWTKSMKMVIGFKLTEARQFQPAYDCVTMQIDTQVALSVSFTSHTGTTKVLFQVPLLWHFKKGGRQWCVSTAQWTQSLLLGHCCSLVSGCAKRHLTLQDLGTHSALQNYSLIARKALNNALDLVQTFWSNLWQECFSSFKGGYVQWWWSHTEFTLGSDLHFIWRRTKH